MVGYDAYQHLMVEKQHGIALITMNRPEVYNATNGRLHAELGRIWLDIGTAEGQHAVEDVRALRSALLAAGWREGAALAYREELDAPHSEVDWAARVEPMLRFLFV